MTKLSTMARGVLVAGGLAVACALLVGLAACGPEEVPIARTAMRLVTDRKAVGYVQAFRLRALENTGQSGARLSCDSYTHAPTLPAAEWKPCGGAGLVCTAQLPWQLGQQGTAQLALKVPTGRSLVFVVEGLAPHGGDVHAVVRGCAETAALAPGASKTLTIDAFATIGGSCSQKAEACAPRLQCSSDPLLPGGYCTQTCATSNDCVPGAVCVLDASGGLCARPCDTVQDCKGAGIGTQLYSCVGRKDAQGACQRVCVWQSWNEASAC